PAAPPPTIVLTDGELFGWRMPHRRRQVRQVDPVRTPDYFAEYAPGDHVVHIEHGIGVFRGIERMLVGTVERDYLKLEYAAGDMLFVPTHQADRVARYVGAGEIDPAVSRLGTADWEKAKARAKRAVEDIAKELLDLYARRESARRQAFAPDTAWQAEMEAAFPFIETPDQLKAIEDVKSDMESERPMDRLVVGDVGFGKTEVALRAAFKAVMAGKQVAVLAPTTVLCQQHFETFSRRLGAFPVRVEMLSRFRTRKAQDEVVDKLATREVDIVIGTHRLLSADIVFKDLGLLIIDEEHRFGVKHKERLRQLREGVDTLTMTATPIPRTMHMALTGLRDLTTIDTPPEERLPVATHIGPYDDNQVRQAIRRELGRRGQVFYVHNRVQGIELVAEKLHKLVPEVRIGIAHGQMNQEVLARAMLDFVGHAYDVLVCTSIIESGLDIPNANTLIVEHAERFGLAQLHQLRGRVGRSNQRAYAYFLHPAGYELPEDARDRLEALAEASRLGSGLRIAMRDLEIRGAGEILGARQHGQVAAIGLDLYTRLLAEAIKKLRADSPAGDRVRQELEAIDPGTLPTVDLPLDAFLPERYVPETGERTRLYRRMAAATDLDTVREIEHEFKDRFGAPPPEVQNLIDVLWLRVLAHVAGARSIAREGGSIVVRWGERHTLDRVMLKLKLDRDVRVSAHQIALPLAGRPEAWLWHVRRTLETVAAVEGRRAHARP
ncbi:MAG: transcription-repair coupling factor, partial [Chloroflexi bacterium CFX6]|nr:transcription-repair coupling factor [Chloroflexi bacterium CFX6]